jgi:hypothetical protein
LSTDDAARAAAKTVIVEEVERLRWRLRNGKAKDAQISIGRIRKVMRAISRRKIGRNAASPCLWSSTLAPTLPSMPQTGSTPGAI